MNDVPQEPTEGEVRELLSIAEIADRFNVSRQTVHNLRRKGVFPAPEPVENSTRARWDAAVIKAYFEANPKQPGRKIQGRIQPSSEQ